jgi:hypothetical protein
VRNELRMRERRALLISVRCAILRVAFLADFVLAIDVPLLRLWRKKQRRREPPPDWRCL